MKKYLCIVLLSSILICANVFENTKTLAVETKNRNEVLYSISMVIEEFYFNKDIKSEPIMSNMLTDDLQVYLTDKIDVQKHVIDLYDTGKENYNVEVILKELTETKSTLYLKFQVISTYNYVGVDFDTTVSEEVKIVYDILNDQIVDFYTPINYYDIALRGLENGLSFSGNATHKKIFTMSDEIRKNKNNLIEDINQVYELQNVSVVTDSISVRNDNVQPKNVTIMDEQASADWARENYNKVNPASGNGVVPYYDFSDISGNWDCTNFVSHALLAGGANINDTGNSGISSTGWYYRNLSNRSSSWSGVNQLYNYLSTSTAYNKATAINMIFQYTNNGAYWGVGDILQISFEADAVYEHSTIITEKERVDQSGVRCYAYVTGRTNDISHNNNQRADDLYPNGNKRVMNVYNYF